MNLGFCSFASSSSGNCYLVKSDNTNILVDVGISGSSIVKGLAALEMAPCDIDTVLLTHEHIDHVRSVSAFYKKSMPVKVIGSEGTVEALDNKIAVLLQENLITLKEKTFTVGDIMVNAFNLSHDAAEPTAYTFQHNHKKLAIVTDTGCVTEEIFEAILDSDILVLEANHEENILLYGRYPYQVKRRILSDRGHLSNEAAGRCLCRLLKEMEGKKAPRVFLAHLSKENNTPQQAFLTVRNILEEEKFYIGKDLDMQVLGGDVCGILTMI